MNNQIHFKPSSKDDEYETPPELVKYLCEKYNIHPKIDVAADEKNKKFEKYFTKKQDALLQEWRETVWCNHPHSKHKEFVQKAYEQWRKHNITILMIIPSNTGRTKYWHKWIEPYATYKMIPGNIKFLKNGIPTKDATRNGYVCVIWKSIL